MQKEFEFKISRIRNRLNTQTSNPPHLRQTTMRKQTKKKERKKKATFQNPFLLFLSSVLSFVFIIRNHLHKQKNKTNYLPAFRCSSSTLFKAEILKMKKVLSPITLHGDVKPFPWTQTENCNNTLCIPPY